MKSNSIDKIKQNILSLERIFDTSIFFDKEICIFILCCQKDVDLGLKKKIKYLQEFENLRITNIEIIVIVGKKPNNINNILYSYDNETLEIECNDYYEGLPEKVLASFFYCLKRTSAKIFFKMDVNLEIIDLKKFEKQSQKLISSNYDLFGFIREEKYGVSRDWHFGKCNDEVLNSHYYDREINIWPDGGRGYALSRKGAENLFSHIFRENSTFLLSNYIYEDVMIGEILEPIGEAWFHIDFMDTLFKDPDNSANSQKIVNKNIIKTIFSKLYLFFNIR